MSEEPFVSIVVVNWNGKDFIRKCLQSLVRLTYPYYEIIVVDNGSTDGSVEFVKREFPGVKLITNQKNLGFASGNNIGIKTTKGDFVALVNNDVIVDSSWLMNLVKAAEGSSRVGLVSGVIFYYEPRDIIWSAGLQTDPTTGITWRIGHGKRLDQLGIVKGVNLLSGCALMIKKEVIQRIGLLDEDYFLGGEDVDWNFCAQRAGYECKLVPFAFAWHMASMSHKKIPLDAYYFNSRGTLRYCFKHFPLRYLFTALFFQLIILPISEILLFKCPVSCLLQKAKAFAWNLAKLRNTFAARKKCEDLGKLKLQGRLRECLKVANVHINSKQYDFW